MQYQKGLTLIELLLVIVLISIIGYIGFSNQSSWSHFNDSYFVDRLVSLCRLSQRIAMASECEVKLDYTKMHELGLFQKKDCRGPEEIILKYEIKVPKNLSFHQSLPLYFQSNGTVLEDNHRLKNQIEFTTKFKKVKISGLTGMVYAEG